MFIGRSSNENTNYEDYHIPIRIDPIRTGYMEQDIWGRYSYNFETPLLTRYEIREENGAVKGGYSFYDEHGLVQVVSYKADSEHGFQSTRTQLPVGAKLDTILPDNSHSGKVSRSLNTDMLKNENVEKEHFAEEQLTPEEGALSPVTETPEVSAARVAFSDFQRSTMERNNLLKSNDNALGYSPFSGTIPIYDQFGVSTPTGYSYRIDNR